MKAIKLIALFFIPLLCFNCSKQTPSRAVMLDYMLLIDVTNSSGEKILKDIPRDNTNYLMRLMITVRRKEY